MIRYLILLLIFFTEYSYATQWNLKDLTNYALENSPFIKKSTIDTEISFIEVEKAKNNHRYGFTLDVESLSGFTFGRERIIIGGVVVSEDLEDGSDFVDPFLSIQFKYPIFKNGRFIFQKSVSEDIALLSHQNSLSELKLDMENLIFSVSNLYLDLVHHNKKAAYYSDSLKRLETILEEAESRFSVNLITLPEYSEVKYKKSSAETKNKIANIDMEVYKKQFFNLLGFSMDEKDLAIDFNLDSFENISGLIPDFQQLKLKTLENSPEVAIAKKNIEISSLNKKLAKNTVFPSIFIRETSVFTTDDSGHFAALGISFPIHDIFKFITGDPNLEKSKLELKKGEITLSQIKNNVELNLFQDYSNWIKTKHTSSDLKKKLELEETKLIEAQEKLELKLITSGKYLEQLDYYEESYMNFENQKRSEVNALLILLKNAGLLEKYIVQNPSEH